MQAPALTREEIRREVDAVPYWWHSIDIGHGVVTPGFKWGGNPQKLKLELDGLNLPPLLGKSVLDIGAYDGGYSFEAERRGASRVVAIDHMVWLNLCGGPNPIIDFSLAQLRPDGLPPPGHALPGKRAFDTAHRLLGSRVESVVADFMFYDLDKLGTFDVVLYLGVLYHVEEPLTALRRVATVTRDLAIVESEAIVVRGFEETPLVEFVPGSELNNDRTNWWVPNLTALQAMTRSAGFSRVELLDWTPHHGPQADSVPHWPPLLERLRRQPVLRSPAVKSLVRPVLKGFRKRPPAVRPELIRGRATLHAWK